MRIKIFRIKDEKLISSSRKKLKQVVTTIFFFFFTPITINEVFISYFVPFNDHDHYVTPLIDGPNNGTKYVIIMNMSLRVDYIKVNIRGYLKYSLLESNNVN